MRWLRIGGEGGEWAVNLVLISTTPTIYDAGFKGLLHPLSKII